MSTPLSDLLRRQRDALERAIPVWQRRVGEYSVATIRETWPDVGGRWPYATGESSAGWVHAGGEGASVRISNEVDHHRYTEYGYTRQGPYTARSYDGVDYSAAAMQSIETDLAVILSDIIQEATRA